MALTASQVRVAGTGQAHVAPAETEEPDGAAASLPDDWTGLGFTSDDGATLARSPSQENIMAWQSVTPVRIVTSELELTVQAAFIQSNAEILAIYFAMADGFTEEEPGEFRGEIPRNPEPVERALIMEWEDGTLPGGSDPLMVRLWLPRVVLSDTGDTSLTRTDAVGWDMTFRALAPDTGPTGVILTNDPAFEPTS